MHERTVVLEVSGVQWASSKSVVESTLLRQPGVIAVEANPVSQTANVSYDPETTSQAQLRQWIIECGYHCAGQSVPDHICDPTHDPYATSHGGGHRYPVSDRKAADAGPRASAPTPDHSAHEHADHGTAADHDAHSHTPTAADHDGHATAPRTAQDVMGHGGQHSGMSMASMIRDMRNRFLVALILSIPITLFSPIGREVIGFTVPAQ